MEGALLPILSHFNLRGMWGSLLMPLKDFLSLPMGLLIQGWILKIHKREIMNKSKSTEVKYSSKKWVELSLDSVKTTTTTTTNSDLVRTLWKDYCNWGRGAISSIGRGKESIAMECSDHIIYKVNQRSGRKSFCKNLVFYFLIGRSKQGEKEPGMGSAISRWCDWVAELKTCFHNWLTLRRGCLGNFILLSRSFLKLLMPT
jgi:hypothetical protein